LQVLGVGFGSVDHLFSYQSNRKTQNCAQRWYPVFSDLGLRSYVLKNEIHYAASGESHYARSHLCLILKKEESCTCGNRTEQADSQQGHECHARSNADGRHFPESVETLRQVLGTNKGGKQYAQPMVLAKNCTKGAAMRMPPPKAMMP